MAIAAALAACVAAPAQSAKIRFDLSGIHADGLSGPPDGLVSVDYEYCVPADPRVLAEVRSIDPSARISLTARGRIGRKDGQALCTGNTHRQGWRQTLEQLAALDYIAEIRRCYWE